MYLNLIIVLKLLCLLIEQTDFYKEKIFNLIYKYLNFSIVNFFIFCKYENWIFSSHLSTSFTTNKRPVLRRFFKGVYLFTTWTKARFLYYTNNWIYTTNHKRIAVNYFWFVILSGIFGMVLATIIRLELAYPGVGIFAGDSLQYLSLATAHGVIMVFFMIIPLISGAFANFLLPTQLGVHDVAFPRLNSAAFWFLPGGLMMLGQLICLDRRYQRMNCFNIREAQSLLKKRFFTDLINSEDRHLLLNKTMIGLRFKTNDLNSLSVNGRLLSTYSLSTLLSKRSFYSSADKINQASILNNLNTNFIDYFFSNNKILSSFIFYILYFYSYSFSTFSFTLQFKLFRDRLQTTDIVYLTVHKYNFFLSSIISFFYNLLLTFKIYQNIFYDYFYTRASYFFSLLLLIQYFKINWFLTKDGYSEALISVLFTSTSNFNLAMFLFNDLKNIKIDTLVSLYNPIQLSLMRLYFSFFSFETTLFRLSTNKFYIKTITHLDYFRNDCLDFFFYYVEKKNLTLKSFWFVIIIVLDYLTAVLNTVVTTVTMTWNFCINLADTQLLYNLHFRYFDFLSLWYFLIVLNTDVKTCFELTTSIIFNEVSQFILFQDNIVFYYQKFCLSCNFMHLFFYIRKFHFLTFLDFLNIFYTLINFNVLNNLNNLFLYVSKILKFSLDYCYQINFNFFFLNTLSSTKFDLSSKNNLNIIRDGVNFSNLENFNQQRAIRFNNPVFKYDYKAGDYFPKFCQENYTYLFTTFGKITGGVKAPSWFLSEPAFDALVLNYANFFENNIQISKKIKNFISSRSENRSSPTYIFYNLFNELNTNKKSSVYYWVLFSQLVEKFELFFGGVSMQERLYANWRQLKFTREAWRCKLLISRHQKSLFRRHLRETGLFWAIERNARDLLPGWAMITPFSSRSRFTAIGKVDIGVSAILLVLISSIISGANFLVTYRYLSTLNNRKMRDARSFFTEGILCSSWMMIAANPMLIIGLVMLLCDRHWQTSFFDYSGGGDTILFQHMFWFFGHPEVYIVIIPTFGFVNTLFSYYLRKRISARASLLYSIYTIAFLGFFVWGHHMYMVGLSHTTRMLFSTLTVMISVPAATKLMHWCVTLVNSSFVVELPFLFMLTYVFLFVSGGISGMCVAHTGMDILFHDTFYVIGHFHVMFAGAAMFGCFGAFYFYFSAIFGVKYSRVYAYMHFTYYLLGQLLTVIPMFWLGYSGMPRRVLDYPSAFGGWHSIITAGHMLSVAGLISFFIMIFDSLRQSKGATRTTLGVVRYNTRLNFYLYEISRISFAQQKGWYLYRYFSPTAFKLNNLYYTNYEFLETTLYSYTFNKRKSIK